MSHVQKRLVTTAAKLASLSATNLAKFPPKQALIVKSDVPQPTFNPEVWASLQPPPPPALSAFAHRIGLASILSSTDLIQQACTHPSFTTLYSQHYPRETPPSTNAQLVILGNSLLGLFATEYLNAKYPYLPTRVQKAALTAHVGPATCASIAQEMGATPLVRWHRTVCFLSFPRYLKPDEHCPAENSNPTQRSTYRCSRIGTKSTHRTRLPAAFFVFCPRIRALLFPQSPNRPPRHAQISRPKKSSSGDG